MTPSQMVDDMIMSKHWAIQNGALWPYLRDFRVYKCGSDPSWHQVTYTISKTMGSGGGDYISGFANMIKITRPASRMFFTDSWADLGEYQ